MIEQIGVSFDWQSVNAKTFPSLSDNELHLWWLPLTLNQQESERALTLLSDIQRDKYHRRMTPELKQSYLAGRYYLLTLLGLYTNCDPEDVELSYSRLNKPYLSHKETHLQFNFTDTVYENDYFGLFGFTRAGAVGVDIESRYRDMDLTKLIARRFTASERDYIIENDGHINQARGLSVWTRKEAYGKATGQGINFKMNQQNLVDSLNIADPLKTVDPLEAQKAPTGGFNFIDKNSEKWRCLPMHLDDHFVATCVYAGDKPLRVSAFNSLQHV